MNYGQHNSSLDKIKTKLGRISSYAHTQNYSSHTSPPDCISCHKNELNRIPNLPQCKAVCGNDKYTKRVYKPRLLSTKVPKRFQYTKAEKLRIQNTPNFMEKMTKAQLILINRLQNKLPEIKD